MRPQPGGDQRRHQKAEEDDCSEEIPQKQFCAFTSKTKRSEPIKADNRSDDEDDPIGVGIACKVERRLHGQARRLSGPFPNICLAGRPILSLSALDRLKIFFSFFGCGAAKKGAEGECEWKRHIPILWVGGQFRQVPFR